jgi:hypothetical protein
MGVLSFFLKGMLRIMGEKRCLFLFAKVVTCSEEEWDIWPREMTSTDGEET